MAKKAPSDNLVCVNRKASYRFEIIEQFECGLALHGPEVKSLREKACSLEEAYARIERGEMWLIGFHIASYKFTQSSEQEPMRRRKVLLHARELRKIRPKVEQRGLTLVPLRIYFNDRGLAKITIALARGKRLYDKRQEQRARDHQREVDGAMRKQR